MYVHNYFKNADDGEVKEFIRQNGFGILISHTGQKLWGTHIPFELTADGQHMHGHLAKANMQWKNFKDNNEVLAIFNGPHTYVSSSWYDHENVPTWNYIAVHVYGQIRLIEGEELYQSLKTLLDRYEASSEHPVSFETMSEDYVRKALNGLVGFDIRISSVEAQYKLSQNRTASNFHNIITQLEKRTDRDSHAVAAEMKKRTPKG